MDRKCLENAREKIWDLQTALDECYWAVLGIAEPEMGWTDEEIDQLDTLLSTCIPEPVWLQNAALLIHSMCERWHVDGDA